MSDNKTAQEKREDLYAECSFLCGMAYSIIHRARKGETGDAITEAMDEFLRMAGEHWEKRYDAR